jgi:hypothetical protein
MLVSPFQQLPLGPGGCHLFHRSNAFFVGMQNLGILLDKPVEAAE